MSIIRPKIKEIAKNINVFLVKEVTWDRDRYNLSFKKLKIFRNQKNKYQKSFISLRYISLFDGNQIPTTTEENDFLKKFVDKRIQKFKKKELDKRKTEEKILFEKGTELLNKIKF